MENHPPTVQMHVLPPVPPPVTRRELLRRHWVAYSWIALMMVLTVAGLAVFAARATGLSG